MIYFICLRFLAFLHLLPIETELELKIILQKQWPGKSAFNGKSQVSERGKDFLNSKGFPRNKLGKLIRTLSLESRVNPGKDCLESSF